MSKPATRSKTATTQAGGLIKARTRFEVWLMAAILVVVTVGVYWPATFHDFVNCDDDLYVTSNGHVQKGLSWEGLTWAFSHTVASNWHPLTLWSHMSDCQMFGLNPRGHHLTSVLLHAVNTVLVLLFLHGLTGAFWRSALVAALFGWHPLHVESVAWVAERKDVLSTCFGLLALIFYVRYARKRSAVAGPEPQVRGGLATSVSGRSRLSYGLALFFFALGLMSKPMLVTWPFVMLLLDYWPLARLQPGRRWPLIREKTPFFALAAVASVVTFVLQQRGGAVMAVQTLPLGARSGNAVISYGRYLGRLFWPTDLAVFYPHPGYWPPAKVLLAGGLILGISGLLLAKRRRYPSLLTGWLWFCGTLVPVIGLLQVGQQAMADRYTYVPSLGVLILAAWGAAELTRHLRYGTMAVAVAGSAAAVLCVALTRQQLAHWQDGESLFRHALEVTTNNYFARSGLGSALYKKGRIDEALSQLQEAARLKPDDADIHSNLGTVLFDRGQIAEATQQYQEALRLKPGDADSHINLGNALFSQNRSEEAIRQYQEALRLKPDDANAHNNLGVACARIGQFSEAINHYQAALHLKPGDADTRVNLGTALLSQGRIDEAVSQFREALRWQPDHSDARDNLAKALELQSPSKARTSAPEEP